MSKSIKPQKKYQSPVAVCNPWTIYISPYWFIVLYGVQNTEYKVN